MSSDLSEEDGHYSHWYCPPLNGPAQLSAWQLPLHGSLPFYGLRQLQCREHYFHC
jgi:hypothetical protein